MSTRHAVLVIATLFAAIAHVAAQREGGAGAPADRFIGAWSGSWEGAGGSGGIEVTFERDKDKGLTGKLAVTGEPTYNATFASVVFDGAKMTAKYDYPPEPAAEVVLSATFEGNGAIGTWLLREKGSGSEVASGSWKISRKEK
jgi:hypothetical protein